MGRYTGPKDKKSRRVGVKLFLKGERDASPKSAMVRRPYPPGVHGQTSRRTSSEYGLQLLEKQKLRLTYGILERQFKKYFLEAQKHQGVTTDLLIERLESRLDNAVYRLGFAPSRSAARQLVSHGHITVNEKKVRIPSCAIRVGDVVAIRPGSRGKGIARDLAGHLKKYEPPSWLSLDKEKLEGAVKAKPAKEEAGIPADIQKIVEFYSR